MMSSRSLFYLLAANLLGGSSYLATGYALKGFSSMSLVFWRTWLGALLLIPFLGRARGLSLEDWLRMGAVGFFGYAAPLIIGTIGQSQSSATNASLLLGVEPVSVILLSALFLGEPLTKLKLASVAAGILGGVVIVLQGIPFWNATITPHFRGDLLLLLHGFGWALYSVIGKPVLRRVDPLTFTAVTIAFSLIPISLFSLGSPAPSDPTARSLWAVFFLGAGVTVLGAWTWNKALEKVPASTMANFVFLQPLIGVLLGVFLQDDPFTAWSGAGGALIVLGAWGAAPGLAHCEGPPHPIPKTGAATV